MGSNNKINKFSLLFFVLIIGSLLVGCSSDGEKKVSSFDFIDQIPEPNIQTAEVTSGYIADTISGRAQIVPLKEKTLFLKQGGRIIDMNVGYHSQVEEGDLLLQLDTENLEHQYSLALLNRQKRIMNREQTENLIETGSISRLEYEIAQLNYEKQDMNFKRLEERLQDASLRAPFTGIITSISAREGETISAYEPLLNIADPDQLRLRMSVSRDDLFYIVPGAKAIVELEEDLSIEAVVTRVPPVESEDNNVYLKVPNLQQNIPDEIDNIEILRAGLTPQVDIIIDEREDALLIPQTALREFNDRVFVHVREGDIIKEADVKTGTPTGRQIEIVKGLKAGQQLIIRR